MKHYVIGVDHGYGYTKTASTMMASGIAKQAGKPYFKDDILEYDNGIYVVGQDRTEHETIKTSTNEYYLLTLAAIAREIKHKDTEAESHKASVTIGAGLPYAFMGAQADDFRAYLLKNNHVVYWYEGCKFDLLIQNVYLFPQGFAVIYPMALPGKNVHAIDIGSRTVDLITFANGRARHSQCATLDKMGTLDCIREMKKAMTDSFQITPPEELLQDFMQGKMSNRFTKDQKTVLNGLVERYVEDIFRQVETFDVNLQFDHCVICGGGAMAVKNYSKRKNINVDYELDISANAKGFEKLARKMEQMNEGGNKR